MPPTQNFLIYDLTHLGSSFSRLRTWVIALPILFGIVFGILGNDLRSLASHYRRESLVSQQIAELEALGFEIAVVNTESLIGEATPWQMKVSQREIRALRLPLAKYPRSERLESILRSLDRPFWMRVSYSDFDSSDLKHLASTKIWLLDASGTGVTDCSVSECAFPDLYACDLRETTAGATLVNTLGDVPKLRVVFLDKLPRGQLKTQASYPFFIRHVAKTQKPYFPWNDRLFR